jgi:hypothetical protein
VPFAFTLWPMALTLRSRSVSCSAVPATPPLALTAPRSAGTVVPATLSTRLMSGASKLKAMSARG